MDAILSWLATTWDQLIARASGPLNFRLVVMPTVVTILAIRAGMRDAREGHPTFLAALFTRSAHRQRVLRSAVLDIGKIFCVAVVLDTAYQIFVLRLFSIVPLLTVAVACAIVPYCLVRGPVALVFAPFYRRKAAAGACPQPNRWAKRIPRNRHEDRPCGRVAPAVLSRAIDPRGPPEEGGEP